MKCWQSKLRKLRGSLENVRHLCNLESDSVYFQNGNPSLLNTNRNWFLYAITNIFLLLIGLHGASWRPFFTLRNLCLLKASVSGLPSARLERTKPFLVSVYKTAGTVSQVISASSSFWSRPANGREGLHSASQSVLLPCRSVLPFFILSPRRFLGEELDISRRMGMKPARKHVPIASIFSISRIVTQRKEVRPVKSHRRLLSQLVERCVMFIPFCFQPAGVNAIKLSANGSQLKYFMGQKHLWIHSQSYVKWIMVSLTSLEKVITWRGYFILSMSWLRESIIATEGEN